MGVGVGVGVGYALLVLEGFDELDSNIIANRDFADELMDLTPLLARWSHHRSPEHKSPTSAEAWEWEQRQRGGRKRGRELGELV